MQIINDIHKLNEPCCVALGFFDGTHTGHRRLLLSMKEHAERNGLLPCVFTFSASPCAALGKAESRALQTFDQRIEGIKAYSGAKLCFAVDFVKYREITAKDFIDDILIDKLGAKAVFCGFNFRFGKNAAGDTALLRERCARYGAEVFVTDPVCSGGETVSSSRIRRLIAGGKVFEANSLLAKPFSIGGVVVHGKENGRTVGIPTLNQPLPEGFVVPRFGAYASFAVIEGKRYRAVTNIGVRPTVSGQGVNCETHILEPIDGELYGKEVLTELLWFERDERKFADLGELAAQIHRDIDHINELKIYEMYKQTA